jgi:hypothetical protein
MEQGKIKQMQRDNMNQELIRQKEMEIEMTKKVMQTRIEKLERDLKYLKEIK